MHGEQAVFKFSMYLLRINVTWKREVAVEFPVEAFGPKIAAAFLLLLFPLARDVQHAVFERNIDILFRKPRQLSPEDIFIIILEDVHRGTPSDPIEAIFQIAPP